MAEGLAGIGSSPEENRASIARTRGKLAAKTMFDPEMQKKYIAQQGEAETAERGGGKLAISRYNPDNWFQSIDARTQRDASRGFASLEK